MGEREEVSMGEREPMSAERLAEIRDTHPAPYVCELLADIDRLRAEVAALRERLDEREASGGEWAS